MLKNVYSPGPWCVFGVSSMCVVSSDTCIWVYSGVVNSGILYVYLELVQCVL